MNKQSSEYARILNVSNTVHSIRSLYKLLSSYRGKGLITVKHLRWSILQKELCLSAGMQPEFFSAGEVSWTRVLRQTFHQKHKKKTTHSKTFQSFL